MTDNMSTTQATMTERYSLETLREAVLAELPSTVELAWIDYRDGLNDEQVAALVRCDWEALDESVDEWLSESRYLSAREHIDDATETALARWCDSESDDVALLVIDAVADDWEHSDEWDQCRWALDERDESDALRDLAGNTGTVYLRIRIGEDIPLHNAADMDAAMSFILELIDLPDSQDLRASLNEILPYLPADRSVIPYLFMSADVGEIYSLGYCDDDPDVTITGGALLIYDPANGGYGMECALPDDFQATVKRSQLRTDDDAYGYGWDDVCGLVPNAFPATLALTSPVASMQ